MAGSGARPGDLFIMGDVDEIPRPGALRALKQCSFDGLHNCAVMEADFFYYSYSLYSGVWRAGPKVRALPLAGEVTSRDIRHWCIVKSAACICLTGWSCALFSS